MSAISIFALVGIFIVLPFLIRSRIKQDRLQENDDYSVIEVVTSEHGYGQSYHVPKDPDEYARIFVPKQKNRN
jgi:hypothetical protein